MSNTNRIRNGRIRRDFKLLLAMVAEADGLPADKYALAEMIAGKHGLYFDDNGNVREVGG